MKKGFTLIELIIYISLMVIILNVGIYFVWQVIGAKAKNIVYQEVEKNIFLSLDKISYEAKKAHSLALPQLPGQETNELVLRGANNSLIRFYLLDNRLWLEDSQNTTNPIYLTTERVRVDELIFRNLSSVMPGTFQMKITISYNNPSDRKEYQAQISTQKTITLRDNLP